MTSNTCFQSLNTNLEYGDQERDSDGHARESGDEPGDPVDGVAEPHHLHDFLEPLLLLIDDRLHRQRDGVDPRHRHAQRHHVLQHEHEAAHTNGDTRGSDRGSRNLLSTVYRDDDDHDGHVNGGLDANDYDDDGDDDDDDDDDDNYDGDDDR